MRVCKYVGIKIHVYVCVRVSQSVRTCTVPLYPHLYTVCVPRVSAEA